MNKELMFSSESDEWSTPQDFYDKLNECFNFTLDPCATDENHKCSTYFTEKQDGLKQSWAGHIVFCNPPYSKPESACKPNCKKKSCQARGYHLDEYKPGQEDWVRKSYQESLNPNTFVVMLIPARTDKEVAHSVIFEHATAICFIKGRLKFGGCKDTAPFPSMLVVFGSWEGDLPDGLGKWVYP